MTQAGKQWTRIVVALVAVAAFVFGGLKYQNEREQQEEDKVLDEFVDGFVDQYGEP